VDIATNIAGISLGGFITWYVSKRYYEKAAKQVGAEAGELKRLAIQTLVGLEEAKLVKLHRTATGEISGVLIQRSGGSEASVHVSAKGRGRVEEEGRQGEPDRSG
jgi:hypothetical protein